jgi:hypothetical protein
MRAGLLLIALAFGCGGSSKPQPTTPPPPPPKPPEGNVAAAGTKPTSQQVCHRIIELKNQKCDLFAAAEFDEAGCLKEIEASAGDPMIEVFSSCIVQPSCEEVTNCIKAAAETAAGQQQQDPDDDRVVYPTDLRDCKDRKDLMKPAGFPRAVWEKRNGVTAKRFSEV